MTAPGAGGRLPGTPVRDENGEEEMIFEVDNLDAYAELIGGIAADPRFSDPHFSYDPDNLYSAVSAEAQKVYAAERNGVVSGIFAWLITPEERYAELIVGLSRDADAWDEMLCYVEERNPGVQFDFVINPENEAARGILRKRNAEFAGEQRKLRLVSDAPEAEDTACTTDAAGAETPGTTESTGVGELQPEYEEQYRSMHTKETYWTAERVLGARDIFRVIAAVDGGQLVGYLDVTTCHAENEPYDLWNAPGYEHFRSVMLAEAIRRNRPNGMVVEVDADDAAEIALYESLGFETIEGSESAYVTYRSRGAD